MAEEWMNDLRAQKGGERTDSAHPAEPVLVRLSDVQPEPVRWLWQLWLAEGTVSVLDGDPGLGKSTLTLDLAARITQGLTMPPLTGRDLGYSPGGVLLLGAEDSLKYTVRPRLDAAGADSSRVYSLEGVLQGDTTRPVVLPYDLDLMIDRIKELEIKLVIVDPLMAFLGGEFDAHKDQDIRRCLRPLGDMADDLGIVILLLRHLNKLSGGAALYRGGSSIAITGAARTSLIVGRDPENADRYVLAMNKTNLGPKPDSLAYHIEAVGTGSRIVWEGGIDLRPDEILAHGPREPGRPMGKRKDAVEFLQRTLASGPQLAERVRQLAELDGIPYRTLRRAKEDLDVQSRKVGATWEWFLKDAGQNCAPGQSGQDDHNQDDFDSDDIFSDQ